MRSLGPAKEPFAALIRRYGSTEVSEVPTVSLANLLASGTDPQGILAYLVALGIDARFLDDLLLINQREDEEELSAHPVREGVAITIASQGEWILFRP